MNTSLRNDVAGVAAAGAAAPAQPERVLRQKEVVAALTEAMPRGAILFRHEDTAPFECDALTAYRTSPMAVVLPETEAQVAAARHQNPPLR